MQAKEVARIDVLQGGSKPMRPPSCWKGEKPICGRVAPMAAIVGDCQMQPMPLCGDLQDGMPEFTWEDVCADCWPRARNLPRLRPVWPAPRPP